MLLTTENPLSTLTSQKGQPGLKPSSSSRSSASGFLRSAPKRGGVVSVAGEVKHDKNEGMRRVCRRVAWSPYTRRGARTLCLPVCCATEMSTRTPSTWTMDNPGEIASGPLGGDVRLGGAWLGRRPRLIECITSSCMHRLLPGEGIMNSPQLLSPLLSITFRASSDTHTDTPPWASSPPVHPLSCTRSTHPWASTQTTSLSSPPRSSSRSEPSPSPV